mmetsp:Transcript_11332/g.45745  ORF Transcript_11332/g.45745 Transcript_11332/m.45745 type:complete len:234 (-) Transcript_11332:29-730(-)
MPPPTPPDSSARVVFWPSTTSRRPTRVTPRTSARITTSRLRATAVLSSASSTPASCAPPPDPACSPRSRVLWMVASTSPTTTSATPATISRTSPSTPRCSSATSRVVSSLSTPRRWRRRSPRSTRITSRITTTRSSTPPSWRRLWMRSSRRFARIPRTRRRPAPSPPTPRFGSPASSPTTSARLPSRLSSRRSSPRKRYEREGVGLKGTTGAARIGVGGRRASVRFRGAAGHV